MLRRCYRHDIKDTALGSSDGPAASLLDDEGHGVAFVQQAQLASWRSLGCRVHKDASVQQCAVDVSDHGANVAQGVWLWCLGLALRDKLLRGSIK